MINEFRIKNKAYRWDSRVFYDLSIPLDFKGEQPNSYDVPKAASNAYEGHGFVGDTRRGGSCNFEEVSLIPHCNGTHTECIGHITNERFSIHRQLREVLVKATLVSVMPQKASETREQYTPKFKDGDRVITRKVLADALASQSLDFLEALIIRTLPNDESKKARRYMQKEPPFMSLEAMEYLEGFGIKHLLVDMPSIDRTLDEGRLSAHHIFWNIEQGAHTPDKDAYFYKTITEMVYVPDEVADGQYLLNLQIAPFVGDATPSRPVIFELL